MTSEQILADLKARKFSPFYILAGEEPYFIDLIANYIADYTLNDGEKEFNQSIVYGKEVDVQTIISIAKRFPMMAEYQVVIVREAQNLKKLEELESYLINPQTSTILVLCHKYKKLDKRKTWIKAASKNGVVFSSDKLRDYQMTRWITDYVSSQKLSIKPDASNLLAEYLGTDLSKVANEVEKLAAILKEGDTITNEVIEKNIGISKDFNIFELQNALGKKDVYKANLIINYFDKNPKQNPLIVVISGLFNYFSKVLTFHYLKDKSERNVAAKLKINPFFVKDYKLAAKHYSTGKTIKIISHLKQADLQSKGVDNVSTSHGEIMKELIFKIMH